MTERRTSALARERAILAQPVIVDPAFDEPDAVVALVKSGGPYGLLYSAEGYARAGGAEPWFRGARGQWVKGPRDRRVPEAEPFFNNPRFITAARQSFGVEVVCPESMKINLNGPMGPGAQHRDVCRFRGATHADYPHWVVVAMHHSELFDAWSVPVASALTWFYRGIGGGLQYWPHGADQPPQTMTPPLWNVAMVCDNEYMFHRVEGVGAEKDWIAPGVMSGREELSWSPDGYWDMRDMAIVTRRFPEEAIRLSILWKAYVFKDEAERTAFDEHTDDLTLDIILDVFEDDLRSRGIDMPCSANPLEDRRLRDLLLGTYPPAAERHFPEARRDPITVMGLANQRAESLAKG